MRCASIGFIVVATYQASNASCVSAARVLMFPGASASHRSAGPSGSLDPARFAVLVSGELRYTLEGFISFQLIRNSRVPADIEQPDDHGLSIDA
jgi:hypothetical protein